MWSYEDGVFKRRVRPASWRFTVGAGGGVAILVLVLNFAFLAWSASTLDRHHGVATAFSGSCETAKRTTLWLHFAINVLGTLLLGASNNCAQLLSSPSRQDVDRAHINGKWMTIGAPSLRNLTAIPTWRVTLWIVLYASSIPIHFLYNSVVFNTISANAYQTIMVPEAFASTPNMRISLESSNTSLTRQDKSRIVDIFNNRESLEALDLNECMKTYSGSFLSTWSDLLLVMNETAAAATLHNTPNVTNAMDLVYNVWFTEPGQHGPYWTCPNMTAKHCTYNCTCEFNNKGLKPHQNVSVSRIPVSYCLARPTQPHCKVDIAVSLLVVVVTCNFIKVTCFIIATIAWKFEPLATVGDAVASYLNNPDPTTQGLALASEEDVRRLGRRPRGVQRRIQPRGLEQSMQSAKARPWMSDCGPQYHLAGRLATYKPRKLRWYHANEFTGWWQFQLVAWGVLVTTIIFAAFYSSGVKNGFGTVSTDNIISWSTNWSLLAIVLLVNSAQLLLSMLYLLLNKVLTTWLAAHEYSKFASVRKTLRVSKPQGQQRTTYWLQLPYRYIVPFLVAMALVHWTMSRSIFLIDVTVFNSPAAPDGANYTKAVGYSPLAIIVSFCTLLAIVLTMEALGFRKVDPGMPIIGLCSTSISAAAHPPEQEKDAALRPLMYGVMANAETDEHGHNRVGFSSGEVTPLVEGVVYA